MEKLTKSMPRRHFVRGVHTRVKYIHKNLVVKEGGERFPEEGIFSGTYNTSLVPRLHPLTRRRVW